MRTGFWLGAALATAALGCGGASKYVPVEGVVTLDGKPVAAAGVTFTPAVGGGEPAIGFTDDAGRFSLTTRKDGDGAAPGKYKVIVTKSVSEGIAAPPLDPAKPLVPETDQTKMREAAEKAREALRKSGIPEIYRNSGTSPLTVEVPAGGKRDVELKLESGAK